MNTQPYHFHVITGEPLDNIRKGNTENILAGKPDSREFRMGEPFAGVHRDRQVGCAIQLFEAMGIERDDKENGKTGYCAASASLTRPCALSLPMTRNYRAATTPLSIAAL